MRNRTLRRCRATNAAMKDSEPLSDEFLRNAIKLLADVNRDLRAEGVQTRRRRKARIVSTEDRVVITEDGIVG